MLKLSLIVMFILSLATLSFASSLMPMPETGKIDLTADAPAVMSMAETEPHLWGQTFE